MNECLAPDQPEPVALAPSRRDFLRGIRSATVGALLLSLNEHDREPSEIEKLLLGIEAGVDGAEKPEVIRFPGANRIFIHARQYHFNSKLDDKTRLEVKGSQADIERILRDLSERGMHDIFMEGKTSTSIEQWGPAGRMVNINGLREIMEGDARKLIELEKAPEKNHEKISRTRDYLKQVTARLQELELMSDEQWRERDLPLMKRRAAEWSAAHRLDLESRVRLHAAETDEANAASSNLPDGDPRYDRIVMQDRENIAIDFFDRSNLPVGICVYGAGHDFRDNIHAHNLAHPSAKMHIVVLTPLFHRQTRKALK